MKRKAPALTTEMVLAQLEKMDWVDQAELLTESLETRLYKEALLRVALENWARCERELQERVA